MTSINWCELYERDNPEFMRLITTYGEEERREIYEEVERGQRGNKPFINVDLIESARGFNK